MAGSILSFVPSLYLMKPLLVAWFSSALFHSTLSRFSYDCLTLLIIIILFSISALTSAFINDASLSLAQRALLWPASLILAIICGQNLIIKNKINYFLYPLSVLALLLSFYALLLLITGDFNFYADPPVSQVNLGYITLTQQVSYSSPIPAMHSLTDNPNAFAFASMIGLFSVCAIPSNSKTKKYLIIIVILSGIFLSGSRASLLGVLGFTTTFVLIKPLNNPSKHLSILLAMIITATILLAMALIYFLSNADLISNSSRFERWEFLTKYWIDQPVFGIGLGSAQNYLQLLGIESSMHSSILRSLFETGIAGSIILTLFVTLAFYLIISKLKTCNSPTLQKVLLSSLVGILLHQTVENHLLNLGWSVIYFGTILGLTLAPHPTNVKFTERKQE